LNNRYHKSLNVFIIVTCGIITFTSTSKLALNCESSSFGN